MEEKVMIFIDGSNLYHSLRNHFKRTDLDIGRFCRIETAVSISGENLVFGKQAGQAGKVGQDRSG